MAFFPGLPGLPGPGPRSTLAAGRALRPTAVWLAAMLTVLAAALPAAGEESYPMVMRLLPVAVQVAEESLVEVEARYDLRGAYQVLVSGQGVTAEVVRPDPTAEPAENPPPLNKLMLRMRAAADALCGPRDFRLATPHGPSTVGQLVVVRDPVVAELAADPQADPPRGDNDTPEGAQPVAWPAVVCGALDRAEDVDHYRLRVEAGQTLVFQVQASRLENRIHDLQPDHVDPIITLRTPAGATLAACDNFFAGDPLLCHTFAEGGEYLIEIRDVRYHGHAAWVYALQISDRPLATNVYPLAVPRGQPTEVALIGPNLPPDARGTVDLSPDAPLGIAQVNVSYGAAVLEPVSVVVCEAAAVEAGAVRQNASASAADQPAATHQPTAGEPAGDAPSAEREAGEPASPATLEAPAAINGRLHEPGQVDRFAFTARKDEPLSIEIVARRAGSALDPHLRIVNEAGAQLAEIDDSATGRMSTADALLSNWTAPADGRYVVEVRDLHLGGGPEFVYLLTIQRSRPLLILEADTDKTPLAPGSGGIIHLRAYRQNGLTGDVELSIDGLPPGVTATCGRILDGTSDGAIVLAAAPDAPPGAANVRISGRVPLPHADGADCHQVEAAATWLQEIYLPGGGRGHFPVEMHTVSVDAPREVLAVSISSDHLTLEPGQSRQLDVTIRRREGFQGNVMLEATMNHLGTVYGSSLPPGVSIDAKASKTLLTGGECAGHLVFVAAADAKPVERQLAAVMAGVSINFVMKMIYASGPLWISVAPQPSAAAAPAPPTDGGANP